MDVGVVASTTSVPRKPILVTEKEETQTPRVPITTPTPATPPRKVTTAKVKSEGQGQFLNSFPFCFLRDTVVVKCC